MRVIEFNTLIEAEKLQERLFACIEELRSENTTCYSRVHSNDKKWYVPIKESGPYWTDVSKELTTQEKSSIIDAPEEIMEL